MQPPIDITNLLKAALAEDIGTGDVTSLATIPAEQQASFAMRARGEMVVCGLVFLPQLFAMIDPLVKMQITVGEGAKVTAGTTLAKLSGPARALLSGERTALNLVQQLSGVATLTAQYVAAIEGTGARILDTRKTIPGLRALQKYAVKCGGGQNHRMGLYDAVLIKDNHIAVAGGVAAAVKAAREPLPPLGGGREGGCLSAKPNARAVPASAPLLTSPQRGEELPASPPVLTIEVECDTLVQLDEALGAGVDSVLLDNMSHDQLREAVSKVREYNAKTGQTVKTEASGNVSLDTVRAIAETGVNYISVGKLTHSAPAVDIGLDEI